MISQAKNHLNVEILTDSTTFNLEASQKFKNVDEDYMLQEGGEFNSDPHTLQNANANISVEALLNQQKMVQDQALN